MFVLATSRYVQVFVIHCTPFTLHTHFYNGTKPHLIVQHTHNHNIEKSLRTFVIWAASCAAALCTLIHWRFRMRQRLVHTLFYKMITNCTYKFKQPTRQRTDQRASELARSTRHAITYTRADAISLQSDTFRAQRARASVTWRDWQSE